MATCILNDPHGNALPVLLLRQVYVGVFFLFFFVVFFHVFLVLFFRLLSVASWAPSRRLLGPTSSVSEANLAPKTEPKSRFLDVQEGTYLKIAENMKIVATPIRKHDF